MHTDDDDEFFVLDIQLFPECAILHGIAIFF